MVTALTKVIIKETKIPIRLLKYFLSDAGKAACYLPGMTILMPGRGMATLVIPLHLGKGKNAGPLMLTNHCIKLCV